jgi:hypothetical protein
MQIEFHVASGMPGTLESSSSELSRAKALVLRCEFWNLSILFELQTLQVCIKCFADRKSLDQHESYHKKVQEMVASKEVMLKAPELVLPEIDDTAGNVHENGSRQFVAHDQVE